MNHALKLVVGIATVTGLMGSEIGVAHANVVTGSLGAASTAFVGASPTDVTWIAHTIGRSVTNSDPTTSRNAVASLGIIPAAIPGFTVNIRGSNGSTGANMVCDIIINDVITGAERFLSQQWLPGDSTPKSFAFGPTGSNPSTATVFCSIPPNVSGGAQIFGVWTQ
jgi:hypothetical protein